MIVARRGPAMSPHGRSGMSRKARRGPAGRRAKAPSSRAVALAMTSDPDLQVMVNAGYFDLATPFYEGLFEMQPLPIRRASGTTSNSISTNRGTWSTHTRRR